MVKVKDNGIRRDMRFARLSHRKETYQRYVSTTTSAQNHVDSLRMRKFVSRLTLIVAVGTMLVQSIRVWNGSAQTASLHSSPPLSTCPGIAYTCITGFPEECCTDGSWACPSADGTSTCT